MQRDVSGPMERLHHRDRMQTASPPPPRVLIEYAKSLLRAPPIRGCLGTKILRHALEWRGIVYPSVHFMPSNFFPRIREESLLLRILSREIRIIKIQTQRCLKVSRNYIDLGSGSK